MQIGDLIVVDDFGVGAISEIWYDGDDACEYASIWLVAQQRYIFIATKHFEVRYNECR